MDTLASTPESWALAVAAISIVYTAYKLLGKREDKTLDRFIQVVEGSNESSRMVALSLDGLAESIGSLTNDLPKMADVRLIQADYTAKHELLNVKLDVIVEKIR